MFKEFSISSISSELMSDMSERFPNDDVCVSGVGVGMGGNEAKIDIMGVFLCFTVLGGGG